MNMNRKSSSAHRDSNHHPTNVDLFSTVSINFSKTKNSQKNTLNQDRYRELSSQSTQKFTRPGGGSSRNRPSSGGSGIINKKQSTTHYHKLKNIKGIRNVVTAPNLTIHATSVINPYDVDVKQLRNYSHNTNSSDNTSNQQPLESESANVSNTSQYSFSDAQSSQPQSQTAASDLQVSADLNIKAKNDDDTSDPPVLTGLLGRLRTFIDHHEELPFDTLLQQPKLSKTSDANTKDPELNQAREGGILSTSAIETANAAHIARTQVKYICIYMAFYLI